MEWMISMHWCAPLLVSTFVIAGALWIGTLFSVSWVSGCARMMADGPEIGRLAHTLFRRWTTPALAASLLAATAWLAVSPLQRVRGLWPFAVVVVAALLVSLHVAVGERTRRVALGSVQATRGEGYRRLMLLVSLGAVTMLATLRAALAP